MTLALVAIAAMLVLRVLVLGMFLWWRSAPAGPSFLPSMDQWPTLVPFLVAELPVFAVLMIWLRTGSAWPTSILAGLAVLCITQGVTSYRRDGLTLLQVDAVLAILLLAGLIYFVMVERGAQI